jgi:hypothetical protein
MEVKLTTMARYKNREVQIISHMPNEPTVRVSHAIDGTEENVPLAAVILNQKEMDEYFKQVQVRMDADKKAKAEQSKVEAERAKADDQARLAERARQDQVREADVKAGKIPAETAEQKKEREARYKAEDAKAAQALKLG